jgi:hypothetical protein
MWGGKCPACKQVFRGRGKQEARVMGEHKTEFYLPFSNRRERCVYSGGTVEDAEFRITPIRRRRLNREGLFHDE